MGKWKELDEKLNSFLRLSTFPIGVKLIKDNYEEEFDKIKFLKRPDKDLVLCQIFSYSRNYGWTMGYTAEDNLCPLAGMAIGFERLNRMFEDGMFFAGRYNETKELAKKTTATMPKIPYGQYSAIVSGALNRIDFDPDLILIWGNSAQITRIIQGYLWKRGGRFEMSTITDGVCADIIASPMIKEELHVAFPCLGDRRFGLAKDSDLIASIPFGLVDEIIEGMEKTHKAGTRYPIPYELATPEFFVKQKKQLEKLKNN